MRHAFALLLSVLALSTAAQPASGTWTTTKRPPVGIIDGSLATVLLDDGSILALGNSNSGGDASKAFRYDFNRNEWTQTGSLPANVVGLKPAKLPNGNVMALGVYLTTQKPVAFVFDPATMQWTSAGATPADDLRFGAKVIQLSNGKVLVLGLSDKKWGGWLYDYQSNTWALSQQLPVGVSGFADALNLRNGNLLVIGIDRSMGGQWTGLLYDPKGDSWMQTGPFPNGMGSTPTGLTTLKDGSVLFLGFQHLPYVTTAAVLYHPETNTWTQGGTVPNELVNVRAATQLPNGMVVTSAEETMANGRYSPLFNPSNNTWKLGPKLSGEYSGLAIFGIRLDGVAWGMGYRYPSGADELIYSPSLNRWTKVASMPEGSLNVRSTGKPDGSSLIFSRTSSGLEWKYEAVLFVP